MKHFLLRVSAPRPKPDLSDSSDTSSVGAKCAESRRLPAGTRFMIRGSAAVLGGLLLSALTVAHGSQPQKFLTFDREMTAAGIAAHPNAYVFVWGATNPELTAAFNKYSQNTLLSTYYPFSRDPDAQHGDSFWKSVHPRWMAYACDGITPVKTYGDRNMTLDITRPEVIAWQISNFLTHPAGIDAVALDNFQFANSGAVCGALDSSGRLVRRYDGSSHDLRFARDAVSWLEKVSIALHASQMKVVVNHIPDLSSDGDNPHSPLVQRMLGAVDGILDEHAQVALHDARKFALLAQLVAYTQSERKWMYLLYQLNHPDRSDIETAVANYLIMAGPRTAIYISDGDKTYGHEPVFLGFDKDVGASCGASTSENGVSLRRYSRGLAIFAQAGQPASTVPIKGRYRNADGTDVGHSIQLQGGAGRVLYSASSITCG